MTSDQQIDLEAQCRWCTGELHAWGVGESQRVGIYELSHHCGIQKLERETPDGPALMKEFIGEPFKLLGKFCSAQCLKSYVKARIEPDTREAAADE